MTRRYAHPSHTDLPETAAPLPTQEHLRAQQEALTRRRERAARARQQIRRHHHDH